MYIILVTNYIYMKNHARSSRISAYRAPVTRITRPQKKDVEKTGNYVHALESNVS
jgi:hypothetical protein